MESEPKPNHLTGKEGEEFDLETAASWTKNHREKHPEQHVSHFYGKDLINKILNQDGCVGIRIYYAYDHDGTRHSILVGANAQGKDIHPATTPAGTKVSLAADVSASVTVTASETYGIIGQVGNPCPGGVGCP